MGAGTKGLAELLRSLDALVLDAGGRHYLAKDFHTSPDAIRRGYPRLDDWLAVRQRVDPSGVWVSDLRPPTRSHREHRPLHLNQETP